MENRVPLIIDNDEFFIDIGTDCIRKIKFYEVIGTGGSCLVYRGKLYDAGNEKTVIIKEYYPISQNSWAKYIRQKEHTPLIIEGTQEEINNELLLRKINVQRELETNKRLYVSLDGKSNNPYIFNAWEEKDISEEFKQNSAYIIIDTAEGETLKHALKNKKQNRYEILEAIFLVKKMLEVVRYMEEKGCIHGDLSLENIYLSGERDNQYVKFLDFGSAFFKEDYQCDENDMESVRKIADKIVSNVSLGSSHEAICTKYIEELADKRERYKLCGSDRYAVELVNALKKMDISIDLYAIVINFYKMIIGREYDVLPSVNELYNLFYGEDVEKKDDILINMLHEIFRKNGENKYKTIEMLLEDLKELQDVCSGNITPKSLLRKLQGERIDVEFDKRLLPQILS